MLPCDREGQFRGEITEYGLKEMDSGAIAVAILVRLTEMWDGDMWADWKEYEMECGGDVWIVGKEGKLNEKAAKSLINFAGWDGNIEAIQNEQWRPTPCQVAVKKEEYKGTTYFKVAFVNDYERTPGALSMISADKAKELQARFGSQFRAMAGNVKRNGAPAPTTAKPPAPKRPPAKKDPLAIQPPNQPEPAARGSYSQGEDIPF